MFKIESYITPIILSYVEKYVKNIRPEDSQLSLWGGEVVFQNLDLKLDVLEEELQLPFNFLSGHIHELGIRVPWTKIASEPIIITINTIEFVLKLRDTIERNVVPKREPPRKGKSTEETPPPGYMASLISKIANNITIRCHNVILKYVEEDIVVSMNIQQLSMESADGSWNPAFIDMSPTKVSLRKLINIVDLTICLDKRNSAGKIEVCQEPVLYRSTLQLRMLVKYNAASHDRSSLTRIDVHSKFLDFNVSSQQFPMLMRLFDLALALKQGKIKTEPLQPVAEGGLDEEDDAGQESLLSWAWNLLPSFFPEENESDHSEEHDFRVLHTGLYIDQLRIIFKTQELIGDGMVGTTKKIKYHPILRFDFYNFYGEMIACGLKWFNVTLGISRIQVQSLEDCPCGHRECNVREIFESIEMKQPDESSTHLDHSFFSDSAGGNRKYNVNWNYHLSSFSQEYLLQKFPAIAIDIIHEVQLPDDRRTSEFGSDLEFSNLAEKYMIRVFVGRFRAKISADTIHRFRTLASYKDIYEYPPYYEDKAMPTLSQLPPPSAEDYDALMHEIPLRQIHITLQSPTIELHTFDHGSTENLLLRKHSSGKIQTPPLKPSLTVQLNRVECNILAPLYPNRLVYTTCQLPEPPAKLFDACYQSISGNLERLQLQLHHSRWSDTTIATAVSMNYQQRTLIHPSLWPNGELNKTEHNLTVTDLKMITNPLQALTATSVVQSLLAEQDTPTIEWEPLLQPQIPLPTADLILSFVHLRKVEADRTDCYKLLARNLKLLTYQYDAATEKSLTALWPDHSTEEDFLTVILQLPKQLDATIEHPPLLYAKLLDLSLNLDPNFLAFLDLWQRAVPLMDRVVSQRRRFGVSSSKYAHRSAHPNLRPLARSDDKKEHSAPATSVHSSSGKGVGVPGGGPIVHGRPPSTLGVDDVEPPRTTSPERAADSAEDKQFWAKLAKRIIFHLEVSHFTVCLPLNNIIFHSLSDSLEDEFGQNEIFMIKLPLISVNSAFKCQTLSGYINRFPISIAKSVWPLEKESFPWTISLANASSWTYQGGEMNKLLDETTTNISMVLTFNDEQSAAAASCSSACFHIDTTPFRVTLMKEQLELLRATLDRLMQLPMVQTTGNDPNETSKSETVHQFLEIPQLPGGGSSSIAAIDLREFLDITHNSSGGSDETLKEKTTSTEHGGRRMMPSLWLQWTFSKLTISCITREDGTRKERIKLKIELEDIIYSLDKQEIYSQMKAKIGGMSGACYEWQESVASGTHQHASGGWVRNEALAITVQTGEASESSKATGTDTFFNMTVTRAETQNVHTKWDTVRKSREHNDTLVEVLIKMEQVDLRLDLDLLGECVRMMNVLQPTTSATASLVVEKDFGTNSCANSVLGVKDLPLILFASKGITVFLPLRSGSTDDRELCSVYIMKINSITVHHNVENPICRVPLRPDVYTKAAQMRILNVPGSKIEDRQYELLLKEISLSTAVWSDVVKYLHDQQTSTTHHDNPAFEWNNLHQGVQRTSHFDVVTVFKEFNFSAIYAPCIIYKNVLICSRAIELNCMSDLVVDIDLDQVQLAERLLSKGKQIGDYMFPAPAESPRHSVSNARMSRSNSSVDTGSLLTFTSNAEDAGRESVRSYRDSAPSTRFRRSNSKLSKCEEDSGLESYRTSDGKRPISSGSRKSSTQRHRKISSISSESTSKPLRSRTTSAMASNTNLLIVPYEVCLLGGYFKVNVYTQRDRSNAKPALKLVLVQPNALVSLSLLERVLQLSLFDLTVEVDELAIAKTVSGEPDELGIPQPIVKTRFVNSLTKKSRELKIDFKRPIKLSLSHGKVKKMMELVAALDDLFTPPKVSKQRGTGTTKPLPKAVLSRNKFMLIKSHLYDIEKIQIGLSQVMLHLLEEDTSQPALYNMKLSLSSVHSTIRVQERPERIVFELELAELLFSAGTFVILHPFSFKLLLTLAQEYWKRDPLVQIKLQSSYLQLDLIPYIFQQLDLIQKVMLDALRSEETDRKDSISTVQSANMTPSRELLIPIVPPRFQQKRTKEMQEEYYQDDLRAGAFQFIESMKINELPLPYQIKIINREVGIICWRYPQPRALHQVIVYPVPMNTTKSVNIQCKLEHYADINGTFVEVCQFTLSENEKTFLKLPQRKIASAIWRIVMTQNVVYDEGMARARDEDDEVIGTSEHEDAAQQRNGNGLGRTLLTTITDVLTDSSYLPGQRVVSLPYRLHPKIFVACMRVDSMFSAALVPNLEVTIDLKPVQINLFNHVHLTPARQLPKPFERYRLCRESADFGAHKFLMLNAHRLRGLCTIYDNLDVFVGVEFNLHCDLLDYNYFTFENAVEVSNMKAYAWIGERSLELRTISDDICIRYGPSIGYNLAVAERMWNRSTSTTEEDSPIVLYSRYIVCNRTQSGVKFGQNGTTEMIYLGPSELCLYAFRSCRQRQQLQLYFTEGNTQVVTEPFDVSTDGLQQVCVQSIYEEDMEDEKMLMIRIESLTADGTEGSSSNTQRSITIEGQIGFYNMTSQRLKFQYRYYKIVPNSDRNYTTTSFQVAAGDSANLFSPANNKNQQTMNIAIDGEDGRVVWSGDVPLREIMNGGSMPYLVKIPTSTITREGYISYWVRIVREKLVDSKIAPAANGEVLERVLVIVWPLFMVESLLTVNTTAYEEKLNQSFSIYGQGQRKQLNVAGTYSDEHELAFRMDFNSPHGEDKRKALLSYRLIDGKTFFQVPTRFRNIENALIALRNGRQLPNWPCSREEELRWRRENSIQEATFPLYHCSAAYEMSCCLMLNIAPWALFINQLGCEVRLRNYSTSDVNIVAPNSIIMPFHVETGFTLEMNVSIGHSLHSELIYIDSTDTKKQSPNGYAVLPLEGSIDINIRTEFGIMNLVLTSLTENKVRIFILASQFIVTNYSSIDLHCWSFALPSNERLEQFKLSNSGPHSCCYSLPKNGVKSENPKGTVITMLNNVSHRKGKIKSSTNFNHYLTIYQRRENGSEFSAPIFLNKPITRKSLSVPHDDAVDRRHHALSLSIVSHQGQQHISIYDDPCPSYAIENRTDFNIYVAQSDTVQPNKAATAVAETVESNFAWFQTVGSRQTVFYTPPALDDLFPEPQESETALIFACVSGSAIRWSHPVKIDEDKSIFLNIPLYGDLKLAMKLRNRTAALVIDYISQDLEFSAKDIRTRLSNPIRPPEPTSPSESEETPQEMLSNKDCPSIEYDSDNEQSSSGKEQFVQSYFRTVMITLFNDEPRQSCFKKDIISFNFERIGFQAKRSGNANQATLHCANIQVDNELHASGDYDFPVVLCSEDHETKQRKLPVQSPPNPYRLEDQLEQLAKVALFTVECDLVEDDGDTDGGWSGVEALRLKINPIRAYIEDTYINVLVDYLMECLPAGMLYEQRDSDVTPIRIRCAPGEVLVPRAVMQQSSYLAEPIKFRCVRIEPLAVLLSVHACMRLYIALDHSPLEFAAFERRSVRSLPIKFGNAVGMHYLSGAIFGGGWVIGSLEILGSPSGLARSVTSGLRDFVSLPVQGLFRGPWGFLVGVTQGSASLIRNITAGTVNSVTKLAQSVSRNLDRLTLDTEHVQRTDALRRRRPQGMTDGFTQGLTGLGISLLGAVGGLAHHPLQATNPIGVVTGMGKGIVGAFAKPISGAAELVALTGQGMLQSVGYNTLPTPKFHSRQSLQRLEPIPHKALWEPQAVGEGSLLFTVQATLATHGEYRLVLVAIYSKALVLYDVHECQLLEVLDPKTVFFDTDEESDATRLIIRVRPKVPPPPCSDYDQYPISSRTYDFVRDSTMQLPRIVGNAAVQHSSSKTAPANRANTTMNNTRPLEQSEEAIGMDDSVLEPTVIDQRSVVLDIERSSTASGAEEDMDRSGLLLLNDETSSTTAMDRMLEDGCDEHERDGSTDDSERKIVIFLDENLVKYLITYVDLLKRTVDSELGRGAEDIVAFLPFEC
ncbi:intermembrane lipid transfer protein VPS13B [Anopheles marshallii]|uniref:intermembrane lipid transfer protein VPS13B n=1 Tax=Anopheles marshallii TaxID=1521116 RepID=UPI00237A0BF7|nr:intermembrane lipid transfer protein VPS13B [Anopheles marshallii]